MADSQFFLSQNALALAAASRSSLMRISGGGGLTPVLLIPVQAVVCVLYVPCIQRHQAGYALEFPHAGGGDPQFAWLATAVLGSNVFTPSSRKRQISERKKKRLLMGVVDNYGQVQCSLGERLSNTIKAYVNYSSYYSAPQPVVWQLWPSRLQRR